VQSEERDFVKFFPYPSVLGAPVVKSESFFTKSLRTREILNDSSSTEDPQTR
jgi:hypothetical protein